MISEANKRASAKYQSNHLTRLPINLNDRTDADIIAYLDSLPNKQGYIKALIRADIARKSKSDGETE